MIFGILKNYKNKSRKLKIVRNVQFISPMKFGSGKEFGLIRKKSIKKRRDGFLNQVWNFV